MSSSESTALSIYDSGDPSIFVTQINDRIADTLKRAFPPEKTEDTAHYLDQHVASMKEGFLDDNGWRPEAVLGFRVPTRVASYVQKQTARLQYVVGVALSGSKTFFADDDVVVRAGRDVVDTGVKYNAMVRALGDAPAVLETIVSDQQEALSQVDEAQSTIDSVTRLLDRSEEYAWATTLVERLEEYESLTPDQRDELAVELRQWRPSDRETELPPVDNKKIREKGYLSDAKALVATLEPSSLRAQLTQADIDLWIASATLENANERGLTFGQWLTPILNRFEGIHTMYAFKDRSVREGRTVFLLQQAEQGLRWDENCDQLYEELVEASTLRFENLSAHREVSRRFTDGTLCPSSPHT